MNRDVEDPDRTPLPAAVAALAAAVVLAALALILLGLAVLGVIMVVGKVAGQIRWSAG